MNNYAVFKNILELEYFNFLDYNFCITTEKNISPLKALVWIGSSKFDLKALPEDVQDEIGYNLHQAQAGDFPDYAKPLKGFSGVIEIICDYDKSTYRAVYATKLGDKIYVLHVFQKKSKSGI